MSSEPQLSRKPLEYAGVNERPKNDWAYFQSYLFPTLAIALAIVGAILSRFRGDVTLVGFVVGLAGIGLGLISVVFTFSVWLDRNDSKFLLPFLYSFVAAAAAIAVPILFADSPFMYGKG